MIVATVSVALGWWLRGRGKPSAADAHVHAADKERTKEAIADLHDLAARVAADVGAHSHRVQQINQELSSGEQDSAAVLAAMQELIQANERMQQQLETAEVRLQEQAVKMESFEAQALTDALTGIANRRAFDDFVARQESQFAREGRPATVLILDVDHFKKFNDTYGHQAGDEVLKGVARVLRRSMREIDHVARYGGEEFAVVFPGSPVAEACPAAERARQAIENATFRHEGVALKVTASFGLAELRSGEAMVETVKRADTAPYAAKKGGRNCSHWHDGETTLPVVQPVAVAEARVDPPTAAAPEILHAKTPAAHDTGIDEATRLSTRRAFADDVGRRVAEWKRSGTPVALVLVGIDGLAQLPARSDAIAVQLSLKAVTQFLKAAMRDMDHVSRYGEDTFGLLLPGANLASAEAIAERLRQAIALCQIPYGQHTLQITVCAGVADARHGDDGERLMQRAEEALAGAREGAINRTFAHVGRECHLVQALAKAEA
jgi:diguanylate cyclase